MTVSLSIPEWIYEEILEASKKPLESAGVMLVSIAEVDAVARILAREIHWVPEHAYIKRTEHEMVIDSIGYMHALARAEDIDAIAI